MGCGTSAGVPRIGNDWGDCDPDEPRNRRSRVSILVEAGSTALLVDTSPDFREQCLANGIENIDAVIWTHDHADHTHGIDDLRQFYHLRREAMPGYARRETLESMKQRFSYAFHGRAYYEPTVAECELTDRQAIGAVEVSCVDMPHGGIMTAGLRFEHHSKSICYATDFGKFTKDMVGFFAGCDIFIVDALRATPHPTHSHLEQTLDLISQVKPRRAILTHMDKSMDYRHLCATLPPAVEPAYDGMVLTP